MLSLPVANSPADGLPNSPADNPFGLGELGGNTHPISHARICALSLEQDDLDSAISALIAANTRDDLIVARLKKRKLQIGDEIAGILATVQMRDAGTAGESIPDWQSEADGDVLAPPALTMVTTAPRASGGSFIFGVFVTLAILLAIGLVSSDVADSLNRTIAQIYLLSLLEAANG